MSQIKANVLRGQLAVAHRVLEGTMAGLSTEQAHWQPGGKAHSIVANYAHVIIQEDVIVSALLKGERPLFATRLMGATGLSELPPLPTTEAVNWREWGLHLHVDLAVASTFSEHVYANTDSYLEHVTDEELDQKINTGFMAEMTKFDLISLAVLTNCNWHTGEISAMKGLQGLQGYPF